MTLSERLNKQTDIAFRVSLFRRAIEGETLTAGESYIFANGPNVEERRAEQADLDAIAPAVERWKTKRAERAESRDGKADRT